MTADVVAQSYDRAVPIADLVRHPDNARQGDETALGESLDAHGFYGAVIAQASSRRVLAGWNRTQAALAAGLTSVPVLWLHVDDATALRIMLVDNRSADLGSNDPRSLADLLSDLAGTDSGLYGTGYGDGDLADLLLGLDGSPFAPPAPQPLPSLPDADSRSIVLVYEDPADLDALLDALDTLQAAWTLPTTSAVVLALVLDAMSAA